MSWATFVFFWLLLNAFGYFHMLWATFVCLELLWIPWATFGCLMLHLDGCTGQLLDVLSFLYALGYFWMDSLAYFCMPWATLGRLGSLWDALGHFGTPWVTLGRLGSLWVAF